MSEQEPSAEHSNHDSVEDQTPKDSPLSPAPSNGDQSDHQQVPLESADSVENSGTIQPLGRAENSGKDDQGNLNPSRMESVVQGDSSLADETSVVPSEENVAARTDHQPFLFIDSPSDDAEDESEKQTAEPLPKEETIPANEPAPLEPVTLSDADDRQVVTDEQQVVTDERTLDGNEQHLETDEQQVITDQEQCEIIDPVGVEAQVAPSIPLDQPEAEHGGEKTLEVAADENNLENAYANSDVIFADSTQEAGLVNAESAEETREEASLAAESIEDPTADQKQIDHHHPHEPGDEENHDVQESQKPADHLEQDSLVQNSNQKLDRQQSGRQQSGRQKTDGQESGKQKTGKDQQQQAAEHVFSDLELSQEVLEAVTKSGYENPTPIQAQIIPHLLDGRDVLAQSQTGTGKTAAFALPILSQIQLDQKTPQVLVLAPTRELAIQVADSFSTYASCMERLSVATIYGGQSYEPQLRQLRGGAQIVVGTPGRVMDHMRRGTLNLTGVKCLVLDEADEMLSMGFLEDVLLILEQTPEDRQIALFSATVPDAIQNIAQQHLSDPVHIKVKKKTMTADSIRHRALMMAPRDKIYALGRMIEAEETDGIIVFTKTKAATLTVAETLCRQGRSAVALNGDMPQATRERTIEQFKAGRLDILVATDVAARGLDVSRVSHVFNFDLPHDVESYIHRVGRTGRAGRAGEAVIFLSRSQRGRLRTIERVTHQKIELVDLPTTDDINQLRIKRFKDCMTDVIAQHDLTLFKDLISQYASETGKPIEMIAAALAHLNQQGRPFLEKDRPQKKRRDKDRWSEDDGEPRGRSQRGEDGFESRESRSSRPRKPRRSGPPEAGMQRYRLEVGRRDGVRPGNIVGAVANEAGIEGEFIGPITINDSYSTIDLPEGMPSDIYQSLQRTRVVGKPLQIKLDDGKRREGSSEEDGRPRRHGGGRGPGKGKRRGPAKGKSHGKKDGGFQQSQFSKPAKAKKKGKKKHKKNPSS